MILYQLIQRGALRSPFSVTNLLRGTREAYLIYTRQLVPPPEELVFPWLGSLIHKAIAELEKDRFPQMLFEEKLKEEGITGIFDLYDPDQQVLYDYKIVGSYKVRDSMCLKDKTEWALQMNFYRYMLEQAGFKVKKLRVVAIVRDYGTYLANKRVSSPVKEVPIPMLPLDLVKQFFLHQKRRLEHYLTGQKLPPPLCLDFFTWGGKKCKKFCIAREVCNQLPPLEEQDSVLLELVSYIQYLFSDVEFNE